MTWDAEEAHRLEAAAGFLELGMAQSALEELWGLAPQYQEHPEVVELRLLALMQENQWNEALEEAKALCELQPDDCNGWIKAGYCLHELKRTEEAKEWLLAGPKALRTISLFHYNLACYECQLGNHEEALKLLKQAIKLDPDSRLMAQSDRDLEPIWSLLLK